MAETEERKARDKRSPSERTPWRVEGERPEFSQKDGPIGRIRNRDRLDRLAEALLERETLDEADVYRIAGIERKRATLPEEQPAEAATVAVARDRPSHPPIVG